MHFKMIVVMVQDDYTDEVLAVTKKTGATGFTVLNNARGEGLDEKKGFLGLSIETQKDLVIFVVEEHLCRTILESIEEVISADGKSAGIAIQIDVEDAIGIGKHIEKLQEVVENEI